MIPPRYRTLDGDEVWLPVLLDTWVVVPRALARFDPELAWALHYDDAVEPDDADPRLDFSAGALLVPLERWNERAALEPNLAPGGAPARAQEPEAAAPQTLPLPTAAAARRPIAERIVRTAVRLAAVGLAGVGVVYVVGVGAWLWSLRSGISGRDVSRGVVLVDVAMLLAWFTGVVGAPRGSPQPLPIAPRQPDVAGARRRRRGPCR